MLFSHNQRPWRKFFLLVWVSFLVLTACTGQTGQTGDPDKRAVLSFLTPLQIESASGRLYDLTSMVERQDGTLISCGLYDATHLVLLYSTDESGDGNITNISHCEVQTLDLQDGTLADLASFDRAADAADHMGDDWDQWGTEEIRLLSADPLCVYDRRKAVLYLPDVTTDPLPLPIWLSDADIHALDGRLWLSSGRGMVCEITEKGISAPVWTLPHAYGPLTPVVTGHSGVLSFVTSLRTEPSARIFVDVDPVSGESAFYQCDMDPARFAAYEDGRLLGTSFRSDPAVFVCDPAQGVKTELVLPAPVQDLLRGSAAKQTSRKGGEALHFGTGSLPLCGDWCCWTLQDDRMRLVRVYLWDTASTKSASWKAPETRSFTPPAAADYGDLSRKASALEDQYGVRIVLGENIPSEFADYAAQPVTDGPVIDGSLSVLENVLSLYPDGYFGALRGSYYRDIVFYLTGPLTPLNQDVNISNAGAFATESCGVMQLAFDLYDDLSPDTVIHELTHAADYRFLGEGLWDEDAWNQLNPEGFVYYGAYIDENGESYETAGSSANTALGREAADAVYFIDPYSKTYAMEDRARLMENLLSGSSPYAYCFQGAHVQEKLRYYFRFLRKTLGDETWPARTSWEEALERSSDS